MQSLTLVYRAGDYGIDDGGSVQIVFRRATDFGPLQLDDPQAPGYTTAEASNGALLELRWEQRRAIDPWGGSLYIGVVKQYLKPDDLIAVRLGDRRFGSPGVRMQTFSQGRFDLQVLVDAFAIRDYVLLPKTPAIEIAAGPPFRWQAILPTLVRPGERFRLCLRADDLWGNPARSPAAVLRLRPSEPVGGLPDTVALKRGAAGATIDGLTAHAATSVEVLDEDGKLLCRTNPMLIAPPEAAYRHYWGDIHGRAPDPLSTVALHDYAEFGRDRAALDVIAHQADDFQTSSADWRDLGKLTSQLDSPARMVCIPGYVWAGGTARGGGRVVLNHRDDAAIYRSSDAGVLTREDRDDGTAAASASALFDRLSGSGCVVIAQAGERYADIVAAHDARTETAVEIHSTHGTFEWLLWEAFEQGYRIGVVANSGGDRGQPGTHHPGATANTHGGLTCFLADRLDRDGIFEAMRRRHHYATTGHRPFLSATAATASNAEIFLRDPAAFERAPAEQGRTLTMGDIARIRDDKVELKIEIAGTAPVERVDIFDGNEILETVRTYTTDDLGARVRLLYEGAEYRGRARTTTWDGNLTIDGNRIARSGVINNWNPDRGVQRQTATALSWKAVTTGNSGAIDLWLSKGTEGKISFETRLVRGTRSIASLGIERHVFSAGGLERSIHLYRLPERMTATRMTISRTVRVRARGDTRLFVRVTQEDGHRAWSSPIYLFR